MHPSVQSHFVGVEKLVRHLHKHGIPMSLATGGDSAGFKIKTQNHLVRISMKVIGHLLLFLVYFKGTGR